MKRPNGTGSVEVLDDGRARFRTVIEGARKSSPLYADAATAARMLAAFNRSRANGDVVASSAVTLGGFGSGWLDERELEGSKLREKVRSIRVERSIWSRHVGPSDLAKLAIEAISEADVETFARWLRKRTCVSAIRTKAGMVLRTTARPLSRSMQKHALRLVKQAMRAAGNTAAADVAVATGGPRPRDLSEDWLRQNEIATLLACAKFSLRNRTVYASALGLALRLDDVKAIEVAHVDLDSEVPGPGVMVWIAKSQRWHRVPVMPWLVPWLRAHLATLPKGGKYLFPAPGGARYGVSYDFGWACKVEKGRPRKASALELAGVARKIRFHDLRGTTATHLALGDWGRAWSLTEIQAMLAHSDAKVTQRYVRRAIDTLAEAAAATPGCPGLPMAGGDFLNAPGQIRTVDLSLRKRRGQRERTRGYADPGQRLGNVVAAEVLAAARKGRVPAALIDELVASVLDAETVRAAIALLKGGRFRGRRAIELAGKVLEESALAGARKGASR